MHMSNLWNSKHHNWRLGDDWWVSSKRSETIRMKFAHEENQIFIFFLSRLNQWSCCDLKCWSRLPERNYYLLSVKLHMTHSLMNKLFLICFVCILYIFFCILSYVHLKTTTAILSTHDSCRSTSTPTVFYWLE